MFAVTINLAAALINLLIWMATGSEMSFYCMWFSLGLAGVMAIMTDGGRR